MALWSCDDALKLSDRPIIIHLIRPNRFDNRILHRLNAFDCELFFLSLGFYLDLNIWLNELRLSHCYSIGLIYPRNLTISLAVFFFIARDFHSSITMHENN